MLLRDRNFLSLVSDRNFSFVFCVRQLVANAVSNVDVDLLVTTPLFAPSLADESEVEVEYRLF